MSYHMNDVIIENIRSLIEEHDDKIREPDHPDIQDMSDLSAGLAFTLFKNPTIALDYEQLFEILTPYFRAAYGVGYQRGIGDGSLSDSE